eukprot:COSAG06_NODE_6747_length_2799_cov_7.865926_3_plen_93_part_00
MDDVWRARGCQRGGEGREAQRTVVVHMLSSALALLLSSLSCVGSANRLYIDITYLTIYSSQVVLSLWTRAVVVLCYTCQSLASSMHSASSRL